MPYRPSIRQGSYVFDDLKTLLAPATPVCLGDVLASVAGCTYIMGVPGADDIMLNC